MRVFALLGALAVVLADKNKGKNRRNNGGKRPSIFNKNLVTVNSNFHFNVGNVEKKSLKDVVLEDKVLPAYDEALDKLVVISADKSTTTYYISTTGDEKLIVERPTAIAEEEGVTARVSLSPKWGKLLTPVPLVTTKMNQALTFTVQYNCHSEKTSNVMIRLRVFKQGANTKAAKEVKEIAFATSKICGPDSTRPNRNPILAGLSVGTAAGTQDVIFNGKTRSQYDTSSKTNLIQIDAETNQMWLYVQGPSKTTLAGRMFVQNPRVVAASAFGEMKFDKGGPDEKKRLGIKFTCRTAGQSLVQVDFVSSDGTVWGKASVTKICPVRSTATVPRSDKDAAGILVNGLMVKSGDEVVINNGLVTKNYKPAHKKSQDAVTDRPMLPAEMTELDFTVKLTKPLSSKIRRPWVSATPFTGSHPVVQPHIHLDLEAWDKLSTTQEVTFQVAFGCFEKGVSNVVVALHVQGQGLIEFVLRKQCDRQRLSAEDLAPVAQIDGLYIGTSPHGSNVAENGVPSPAFSWGHLGNDMDLLHTVYAEDAFVTFYLRHDTGIDVMPFAFGTPELISAEELAETDISGIGAQGGYLDSDHKTSSVSLTFHCLAEGQAVYTLIIPLTSYTTPVEEGSEDEVENTDEPYLYYYGRRLSADKKTGEVSDVDDRSIRITFVKQCSFTSSASPRRTGLGGFEVEGLKVCLSKECKDGEVVVNHGFPTAKYFGQKSLPESQRTWDIIPVEQDSLRLFFNYEPTSETDTIRFGPINVPTNDHKFDPELSGSVSSGSKMKSGVSKELDITFHCEFAGLSTMTLVIPFESDSITFTLAKQCGGKDKPRGVMIGGLMIGTTPGGSEVVNNGQTTDGFQKFLAVESTKAFSALGDYTLFYIRTEKPTGVKALEPMVFAHRPHANVDVSHTLHVQSKAKTEENDLIIIGTEEKILNVSYNCIFPGMTAVSLELPLQPKGRVSFHWIKNCGANTGGGGDSVDSEDYYYYGMSDFYDDSYDEMYYDSESDGYFDSYDYSWSSYDYSFDYMDYAGGDYGDMYDWDEIHWNPDDYDYDEDGDGTDPQGSLNVGMFPDGVNDVVSDGRASDRFSMPTGNSKMRMQTTFGNAKTEMSFLLSVPEGYQKYGVPMVFAMKDKKGQDLARPQISGGPSNGGSVEAGTSQKLTLEFNCVGTGVTPIMVAIPLIPSYLGSVSFRVVKVCGEFEKKTDFAWTPNRVIFTFLGAVVLVVGVVACWLFFRTPDVKYAKVAAENQDKGAYTVELDNFDGDLSDD